MKKLWPFLLVNLLVVMVSAGLWGQASPTQPTSAALFAQESTFIIYSSDFSEFAKAHPEEYEPTDGLQVAAVETTELLNSASTMVRMYETLECSRDRVAVLPIVTNQLQFYMKQVDNTIAATNNSVTYVKTPATAQLGLQMKADLRHVKETLELVLTNLRS